jgi:hypothetical protein
MHTTRASFGNQHGLPAIAFYDAARPGIFHGLLEEAAEEGVEERAERADDGGEEEEGRPLAAPPSPAALASWPPDPELV